MSAPAVFFYLFGAIAVVSALAMVLNVRNTVAAAMSLVVTMIALAATYVTLEAHLIAALQIMVYAGAIVVVFLFVVMLLNLRRDDFPRPRQVLTKGAGVVFGDDQYFAHVQFLAVVGLGASSVQTRPLALSAATSSAASFTITPRLRVGGGA